MKPEGALALSLVCVLAACTPEPPQPPTTLVAKSQLTQPVATEPNLPAWTLASRKRYAQLLDGQVKGGTLVLPFAVGTAAPGSGVAGFAGGGADLNSRMVMAHLFAQRLAASGERVADPVVVGLALGEAREWTLPAISSLAAATGAARVVAGKASWRPKLEGTELRRELDVVIEVYPVHAAGASATLGPEKQRYEVAGVPISGATPPEMQFAALIPKIATQLGLALDAPAIELQEGSGDFPATPRDAAARADAATPDRLWASALVAALNYPGDGSERGRHRAHERLLATADRLAPTSRDRRLLQARAFAALERREAALAVLGTGDGGPEEAALRAYLDGDLPALEAAAAKIQRPIPRLLAELDRFGMAWIYGLIERDQLATVGPRIVALAPEPWQPLVAWHLMAYDSWSVPEPLEAALFLDGLFPATGDNLESQVRGKLATGGADVAQLNAVGALYPSRVAVGRAAELCCLTRAGASAGIDLLLLLDDETTRRIVKGVAFLGRVQGRPLDAIRLGEEYERTELRGHPDLALERIDQLMRIDPARFNPQSPGRKQLLDELAVVQRALPWQGVQSDKVRQQLIVLGAPPSNRDIPWASDFPGNWLWIIHEAPPSVATRPGDQLAPDGRTSLRAWRSAILAREACLGSLIWVKPCISAHSIAQSDKYQDAAAAASREIEARFVGSFPRVQWLAERAAASGEATGGIAAYESDIAKFPDRWASYNALMKLQLAGGEYKEAAQAAIRYPLFQDPSRTSTVALSNRLYDVASALVLRGAVDEAKPLLKTAAGYRNGSAASLWAHYQLAAVEGRYADAQDAAGAEARRYQQQTALRRYASMLFMQGDSKTGWAVFEEGRRISADFDVWRAAAVGLRAGGANAETTLKWVADLDVTRDGGRHSPAAEFRAHVALQVLAVDRSGAGLAQFAAMETRRYLPEGDDSRNEPLLELLRANPSMRSRLANLAEGYAAFQRRDHSAAYEGLKWLIYSQENDKLRLVEMPDDVARSVLPYLAFAAAKTGNGQTISDAVAAMRTATGEDDRKSFDHLMVRAVFAALAQRYDEASESIKLARANMTRSGMRPLPPDYAYAELLELLAAETGRKEYLATALDWARRSQSYEPFAAWAYAFEARHSTNDADRTRALAIALYLDPQSARLTGIDAASKERARAWFKAKDPLGLNRPGSGRKPEQAT